MKSIELLKYMKPATAAATANVLEQIVCPNPALTCIWCPYQQACAFIDVLYHDLKGEEAFEKAK